MQRKKPNEQRNMISKIIVDYKLRLQVEKNLKFMTKIRSFCNINDVIMKVHIQSGCDYVMQTEKKMNIHRNNDMLYTMKQKMKEMKKRIHKKFNVLLLQLIG